MGVGEAVLTPQPKLPSYADDFEYVMHGKVFREVEKQNEMWAMGGGGDGAGRC